MKPKFFSTQKDFRQWLEAHHERETELLVGFYKVGSGKPSMNWSESVDQALCYGWIDGVRRSLDAESYAIRFTPRKSKSIWSAVNIKKVAELSAKGAMRPAGVAAFEKRTEAKSGIYSYENELKQFSDEFEMQFKEREKAWQFFEKQANWYKKQMVNWVMTAKQQATREKRLEKLITESENGKRA